MKNLFKKAQNAGKEFADSVKDEIEGLKKEKGFLVEQFGGKGSLQERLNELQEAMKKVTVQSMCYTDDGYFIVVIKVED